MKTKLIALMLLLGSSAFAAHFSFGIGIGPAWGYYAAPPPPPPAYAYSPPVAPYLENTWIAGYWYPMGPRWYWRAGYWTRPPYAGAVWLGPRYYGGRYYRGYWRR